MALELEKSNEVIRKNVIEMDAMIAELLESARLSSPNGALRPEPVEVSKIILDIEELAAKYQQEAPGVRILSKPSLPDGLFLRIDPERIRSVFKNLIENAIKYSPKDRKPVEISFERVLPNSFEVIVQDYGIGISEQEQSRVFEPFYRVDKSRCKETGGYGLGLSLCQKIMKAHGGDLKLTSTLQQGTRVVVVFTGFF